MGGPSVQFRILLRGACSQTVRQKDGTISLNIGTPGDQTVFPSLEDRPGHRGFRFDALLDMSGSVAFRRIVTLLDDSCGFELGCWLLPRSDGLDDISVEAIY